MTFLHDSTSGLNGQNAPSNSVKTPLTKSLPPVSTGNSYQDADYVRVRAARESGCTRPCGNQPDKPVCTKCFVNLHAGKWETTDQFVFGYNCNNWEETFTMMSQVKGWIKPPMTAQKVQLAQANAGQDSPSNQAGRAEFEADPEKWLSEALDDSPEYPVMDYPEIETLSEYERATLIQSLRHYFDLLDKHNSPGKEIVLQDVTKLQNKLLASMPIKSPLPTAVTTQLDRMEALLLEIKAGFTFNPQGLE